MHSSAAVRGKRSRWAGRGSPLALLVVAALAAGAVPGAAKAPAVGSQGPKIQSFKRVPTSPLVPHAPKAAGTAPKGRSVAAPVWPKAGTTVVDLTQPAATAAASSAGTSSGASPVVVSLPSADGRVAAVSVAGSAGTPSKVSVQVHAQPDAIRAGVNGVLFTVAAADADSGSGTVTAHLSYAGFANAFGADWGSRLHLVELPACAITTPQVLTCRTQIPLPGSRNDAVAQTVSADVHVLAYGTRGGTASATVRAGAAAAQSSAGSMTVMAAVSGGSSTNGDFTAAPGGPSGTWSAGGNSGSFSWSYPLAFPKPAAGSAPSMALGYDSSGVDGSTATTNNQSDWIGQGWSMDAGSITRSYRSCSEDMTLPAAEQTGDQCWAGQVVMMNLGGSSTPLVLDDATKTWHAGNDSGDKVEVLTGASNGVYNGEYWRITDISGTQYYFGRNSGPGHTNQGTTNSAWTVPVYGAHSGDPCYSSSGFAASSCLQAWQWNLDYVEDVHGDAQMYYYTPETNYYGADNGTTGVAYTRDGYLSRIDYGIRDVAGSVYGPATPDQVTFGVSERCLPSGSVTCDPSQMTAANASSWPDTPVDQACAAGSTCSDHAPTFWSTKRLTSVTAQYWNGTAYTKVDSYALAHQFPNSGDPDLWLSSITHTGYATDGTSITKAPISFNGQVMDNRVQGYLSRPSMGHWRLTSLTTDTGSVVNITYAPTQCSATNVPADQSTNTMRCFPVYWTWPGDQNPSLDWFHKYVVSKVSVQDSSGYSPQQVTAYTYVGNPAWHYDDNELVKPANRTYGQFRGYGEVDVSTGDPVGSDPITLNKTTYFQGMDGDTLPGGKTRSATVSDSLGETVPDNNLFAGSAREIRTFTGVSGAVDDSAISDYTVVATTGSRTRTGLPALTATIVRTASSRARKATATGGWINSATATTYDAVGRTADTTTTADGLPTVCAAQTYADNTTLWIRDHVAEKSTAPGVCPAVGTALTGIIADVRTYYDQSTTLGSLPGPGDATRTDQASSANNASFITTGTASYDPAGRVVSSADALGRTTTTTFTPDMTGNPAVSPGPLTQIKTTNPLNQSSTQTLDPGRGVPLSSTDIAGHTTTTSYDALGRVTAVYRPGNALASRTYSYQVATSGPIAVTTKTLVDYGTGTNYATSISLYDSLGQLRETQGDAEGGGRIVSDTFYDSHGWKVKTNNGYATTGAPAAAPMLTTADAQVPDQTRTTFDALGRATVTTEYADNVATWHSTTVYGGDRTTVFPPSSGTIATTKVDAAGRTSELDQYTSAPTVTGNVVSGGTYQPTTYTYTLLGSANTVTDPAGDIWSYGYDFLGRKTSQTDPDAGTSSTTYDNASQVLTSTDADNNTLAYTYDALGRKTGEYQNSTTGTKLATWVYDTLQAGQLTAAVRWVGTSAYAVAATGFDGRGRPTGTKTVIPAAETGLAGTYTTSYTYTSTDQVTSISPAKVGGLPLESVSYTYDTLGKPLSASGYAFSVNGTAYSPYGLVSQCSLGSSNAQAWLSYGYDLQTLKVTDVNFSAQTASRQIDDTSYTYDQTGRIIKTSDVQGPAGSAVDTQCFTYDALQRLTSAWTGTDNCATQPAVGSTTMVGGPAPYWTSWTFDSLGDRAGQTQHSLTGGTDTVAKYGYPTPGANVVQPHAVTGVTTTGSGATNTGYKYDAAGNTLKRTGVAGGDQILAWDPEERLTSVGNTAGTTSFLYDANGGQLIRRDPGQSTLYLPGEELTYQASGSTTATRYYSFNGQSLAEATDAAAPAYLDSDLHGTNSLAVDSTTFAVARRSFDPYGNTRGTSIGTWPDTHGFLNAPNEASTGLTDIGARKYDPATGRFISVDPVFENADPQQFNGYSYAGSDPVNMSDPTGLNKCDVHPDQCSSVEDGDGYDASNLKHQFTQVSPNVSVWDESPDYATYLALWQYGSTHLHNPKLTGVKWEGAAWTEGCDQKQFIVFCVSHRLETMMWGAMQRFGAAGKYFVIPTNEGGDGMVFVNGAGASLMTPNQMMAAAASMSPASANMGEGGVGAGFAAIAEDSVSSEEARAIDGLMCSLHSFAAGTKVLMADGSAKPIEDVKVGDEVENAQPGGHEERHEVDQIHKTLSDSDFTDLTVNTFAGPKVITGTQNHPYYDLTDGAFVDASQLKIGDRLQSTKGGDIVRVLAVRNYASTMVTYDLTIDELHTYYVEADGTPVLVHNTGLCPPRIQITPKGLRKIADAHLFGGSRLGGRSQFWDQEDPTDLINAAQNVMPMQDPDTGNWVYTVNAGRSIGVDRTTGLPTDMYTVVTNSNGHLVTAYPGTFG